MDSTDKTEETIEISENTYKLLKKLKKKGIFFTDYDGWNIHYKVGDQSKHYFMKSKNFEDAVKEGIGHLVTEGIKI